MNKLTFAPIFSFIALFLLANNPHAQQDITMAKFKPNTSMNFDKSIIEPPSPLSTKKLDAKDVRGKTQKSFSKLYKGTIPSWSALDNNFLATFELNGRHARALFSGNGYALYTIIRGTEKDLPNSVRGIVKSNYYDFTIGTVNEVRVADKTAWFVNFQSNKELVVVKVVENELEVVSSYILRN